MDDSFRYSSRHLPRDDALAARQLCGPIKATGKIDGLKKPVEEDLRVTLFVAGDYHAVNSASLSGFATGVV